MFSFKLLLLLLVVVSLSILLLNGSSVEALTQADIERDALLAFMATSYSASCMTTTAAKKQWTNSSHPCDTAYVWSHVICSGGSVVELDFAFCGLSGTISPSLSALSNLTVLDLSYNSFVGKIPTEFGLLPKLSEVYLDDNHLSNKIPVELFNPSKIPNLARIDLSNNALTGTLPSQIASMPNLIYISLAKNMLTGSVPIQIGSLKNLYDLYLDNNLFSGAITTDFQPICSKNSRIRIHLSCNQITSDAAGCLTGLPNCTSCVAPSVPTKNNSPLGQCTGYISQSASKSLRPQSKSAKPAPSKSPKPVRCAGLPVFPANTDKPGTCVANQLAGTSCQTKCSTGYARVSGAATSKCGTTGLWSKITLSCKLVATKSAAPVPKTS